MAIRLYLFLSICASILVSCSNIDSTTQLTIDSNKGRVAYYQRKLQGPDGTIPANIRAKELAFAKTLPQSKNYNRAGEWTLRGPNNIGGRVRALAQDIKNPNVILSGSISGGLFRSTDKGKNWKRVTSISEHQGVSWISQDTRAGKEHIWYYCGGEAIGNSASGDYASIYGANGVYKSVDSGKTWVHLEETANKTPQSVGLGFDQVYRLAIDQSTTEDIVYAACYGGIQRSTDGGETWDFTLTNTGGFSSPIHSDLVVAENNMKYAFISKDVSATSSGIHYSADGINWTNITPSFASKFNRMVITTDPGNGNILYVFGETPDQGKPYIDSHHNESAYVSLWRYNHANGEWVDLSDNLPSRQYLFDGLNPQTGYNLVVAVSPNLSNNVLVGCTNLYISETGFEQADGRLIGGYIEHAQRFETYRYPNHHPDNHVLVFDQESSTGLFSGHDGGISYTTNYRASEVEWEFRVNNFFSTQSHTIHINENGTDDIIITGLQDNGSLYTGTNDINDPWVISLYGDGAYAAISDDSKTFYCSSQSGNVAKLKLDEEGNMLNAYKIKHTNMHPLLFINPLILDPNDDNIMYYLSGASIWRCPDLSVFPIDEMNYENVNYGWEVFTDSIKNNSEGYFFTSLSASKGTNRVLYAGTVQQKVYKYLNPHIGDPERIEISDGLPGSGYVTDIAIDPSDENHIVIVFSNYNIISLWESTDGGENYVAVAGNLEERENGSGNGPSCRTMRILNGKEGNKIYLLGTSVGLFTTNTLDGDSTKWIHVADEELGASVIEMIAARTTDNLVALGTHGNGVYSNNINYYYEVNSIEEKEEIDFTLYPNPANNFINIDSEENINQINVYDELGRIILTHNSNVSTIDISQVPNGKYYLEIVSERKSRTKLFLKQ